MAESAAYRAGQVYARRKRAARRASDDEPANDPHAPELEWPELRKAILRQGGIGPSPDWDRADYPGDLYREHGKPPDLVAEETALGREDRPPWGDGGDDAMFRYLRRAHEDYERAPAGRRYSMALSPMALAHRRAAKEEREAQARRAFGAGRLAREQAAHHSRVQAMIAAVRARRREKYPEPAVGFFTDEAGEVHPITRPTR